MPCNASYARLFLEIFRMYYNLICIFICTPICTKKFILAKSGCYRWLELIKDYDHGINYHPRKANVVADALSRKKYCNATFIKRIRPELHREIRYLNPAIVNDAIVAVEVKPTFEAEIQKWQLEDAKLKEIR
jgi:hypothetical protein